jgi:hypothetical protein
MRTTTSPSGLDLGLDGMVTLGIGIVLGPLAFAAHHDREGCRRMTMS